MPLLTPRAARIFAAALFLMPGAALAGDVTVTLEGVKDANGVLLASLQTQSEYLKPGGALQQSVPAAAGPIVLVFRNVPAGEYALTVVHDANRNNTMDMGPGGIPTEGWGTFKPELVTGPPSFDSQKMMVGEAGAELKAGMIYFGPNGSRQ